MEMHDRLSHSIFFTAYSETYVIEQPLTSRKRKERSDHGHFTRLLFCCTFCHGKFHQLTVFCCLEWERVSSLWIAEIRCFRSEPISFHFSVGWCGRDLAIIFYFCSNNLALMKMLLLRFEGLIKVSSICP